MTDALKRAEELAASGCMFFFGKSVVAGNPRFATIRSGGGDTVATGKGQTCEEALIDAMSNIGPPRLDLVSEPQLKPVMPRAMPGIRKLPGM